MTRSIIPFYGLQLCLVIGASIFAHLSIVPTVPAVILILANAGIAICYRMLPEYMDQASHKVGISIRDGLVQSFVSFIQWCGHHHTIHYPLMFAMMAGWMAVNMGHPETHHYVFAYGGLTALLLVDLYLLFVSISAVIKFRRDKLGVRAVNGI